MMHAPQPVLAPGARPLSLQRLARAGATLVGRVVAIDNAVVHFDHSAPANIAAGDAFAAQAGSMLDAIIARLDPGAPSARVDAADRPVDLDSPAAIELREIAAIIWATGLTGNFGWLHPDLLDAHGRRCHDGTQGTAPGLSYVGLRWLTRRSSATLLGMSEDAASAARGVQAALARVRP